MKLFKVISLLDNNNTCYTIKNVFHKKGWGADTKPDRVKPPQIPLVKQTSTGKSYGDYVKLKLRKDPTFSTPDLYDFRISLFEHVNPEEFL